MGAYVPKGLILSGAAGIGKTMLAKAIASESGVPLFEFESTESENEENTIKSIKELFSKAREAAPSIIFIDELDELVSNGDEFISDYSRKVEKMLLTEIDGISSTEGVLVIATTNHRYHLPRALIRSGRMDKRISMDLPNVSSREAICKLYLTKNEATKDIDAKELSFKTAGFSGADIKTMVNEVIINCAANNKKEITMSDFEEVIPVIRFQDIKKAGTGSVNDTVCYHEIGHFVCEYAQTGAIGNITIEAYGQVRGHVMFDDFPFSEVETIVGVTKNNLQEKLVTMLGGIAAEEVFVNDLSTGCCNDMNKAREAISSLIASGAFGFDALPSIRTAGTVLTSSDDRKKKAEEIETQQLTLAYERAKSILGEHKPLVNMLLTELKAKNKLSSKDASVIVDQYKALAVA